MGLDLCSTLMVSVPRHLVGDVPDVGDAAAAVDVAGVVHLGAVARDELLAQFSDHDAVPVFVDRFPNGKQCWKARNPTVTLV